VQTEQEFLEKITDRPLSWTGGYNVRFHSSGEINGRFPGGIVEGKWQWEDNLFCRSIRVAGIPRNDECLAIEYSGQQVRFKRSNGSYFLPYRIGPAAE